MRRVPYDPVLPNGAICMVYHGLVTENKLDEWVRGNAEDAQGVAVELIWRLVAASSPNPRDRRFPLSDSIGQHGPDGELDAIAEFLPFVPEGKSVWEIGTGLEAGRKATSDYRDRTESTPPEVRAESDFIFVTPLSGRRDWTVVQISAWLKARRKRKDWRNVHVIDGTRLIDWLHHFPMVDAWLAMKMGMHNGRLETIEQRWDNLKTIGEPPVLIPELFLANREAACQRLKEVFDGTCLRLRIDTHFPDQRANFVAAYVAALDEDSRIDVAGRCVVVQDPIECDAVFALGSPHVVIADFDLDERESYGVLLLEKAKNRKHAVVFAGAPGGTPQWNRVGIPNPHPIKLRTC